MKANLQVYITPEAHAEIMYYVHKSSIEISGLGRIKKLEDGSMVVHKIYLLEQENGATTTDIDEDAMSKLLYDSRNDEGDLNFWWHSHVDMGVFWSGTDMDTIQQFGRKGYLLATVFNKKGEHRTAFMQGSTGFLPEIFIDEIPTSFRYLPSKEQAEVWQKEFETKPKTKVWTPSYLATGYTGPRSDWNGSAGWGDNAYTNDYDDDDVPLWKRHGDRMKRYDKQAVTNQEYIGGNSGATQSELVATVKRWYFRSPAIPFDELSVEESMQLLDIIEFVSVDYGDFEPEELYEFLTATQHQAFSICDSIRGYGSLEDDADGIDVKAIIKAQNKSKKRVKV